MSGPNSPLHAHDKVKSTRRQRAPSFRLATAPAGTVSVVHLLHDPVLTKHGNSLVVRLVILVEPLKLCTKIILFEHDRARFDRSARRALELMIVAAGS